MAGYDPGEMNSLFCDVMKHSGKFSDVTSDEGAANFNQMFFAKPLPEAEAEQATPLSIEVIDSVVRKESGVIAGIGDKVHVEYIIAIKRGLLLKTLGKRYSELHEFHNLLVEHKLIDKIKAPPFPEKQSFRDGWYKFDSTDTSSAAAGRGCGGLLAECFARLKRRLYLALGVPAGEAGSRVKKSYRPALPALHPISRWSDDRNYYDTATARSRAPPAHAPRWYCMTNDDAVAYYWLPHCDTAWDHPATPGASALDLPGRVDSWAGPAAASG
ncbi:hypothetical protein JL720_6616 [Aureococcus anophagefferens]|nr:hypothetical protein JL720_6616 [Aureococcus anophagefferens]